MSFHISLENAIRWTELEVKGNESFIYKEDEREDDDYSPNPDCYYLEGDYAILERDGEWALEGTATPSCLVGRALLNHTTLSALDILSNWLNEHEANAFLEELQRAEVLTFDRDAARFFKHVQSLQDEGTPWGETLRKAKVRAAEGYGENF